MARSAFPHIKVLHFADVHVGMENYGRPHPETGINTRVLDYLERMDEMIKREIWESHDLVVFAGDAFKTRSPNPTYQREFARRMVTLSNDMPVVMLAGNHDLPMNSSKASSIDIHRMLNSRHEIWLADDYDVRPIATKSGFVIVGTAPYPTRSRLFLDGDHRSTIKQQSNAIYHVLEERLAWMAQEADRLAEKIIREKPLGLGKQRFDDSYYTRVPRILVAHFTVHGAQFSSERAVMLGQDVAVELNSLVDDAWDYVALGHIHKHQDLTKDMREAPPVVYSGSLERIDFGEEGEEKGYVRIDLHRYNKGPKTSYEFIPVEARPMRTIRVDARKLKNPTQEVIDTIEEMALGHHIVRVIVKLDAANETLFDEKAVTDALRAKDVHYIAGIRKDVERADRSRLGDNPEALAPVELVDKFFKSRGVDRERRDVLVSKAKEIIE